MTTEQLPHGKPLKCYVAGSIYPNEFSHVEACVAHSHAEAKALMWRSGSQIQEECDHRYVDMRVQRHQGGDSITYHYREPSMVRREHKRALGWFCDGDSQCQNCELYEMDGDFPVCEECEQCTECGHADGCSQASEGANHE